MVLNYQFSDTYLCWRKDKNKFIHLSLCLALFNRRIYEYGTKIKSFFFW